GAGLGAYGFDALPHRAHGAGEQELVRGPEVGAPPDPGLRRAGEERAFTVEHHHGRTGQPVLTQPASGGDEHRLADVVERNAVPGGQRLDGGDAGDDVVADLDVFGDPVQDAQRAVVQRRVTPGEKGADPVRPEL